MVLCKDNKGICRKLLVAREGRLQKYFYIHIFTEKQMLGFVNHSFQLNYIKQEIFQVMKGNIKRKIGNIKKE